jgi:hypothetical protein
VPELHEYMHGDEALLDDHDHADPTLKGSRKCAIKIKTRKYLKYIIKIQLYTDKRDNFRLFYYYDKTSIPNKKYQ